MPRGYTPWAVLPGGRVRIMGGICIKYLGFLIDLEI